MENIDKNNSNAFSEFSFRRTFLSVCEWLVLTQPHVLQVYDEATGQIKNSEKGVSHEGWGLEGG